jgi:hypothetical protein
MHDLGPVEEPLGLLGCEPVPDVRILEDLQERSATLVLPDHVRRDALLLRRTGEEEGERAPKQAREIEHRSDCILRPMRRKTTEGRFAERVLQGFDDAGAEERIVLWIERRAGALWAVGRAINPQHRSSDEPRADDYIFQGYELEDALEHANGALRDDLRVSEQDRRPLTVEPFAREELLRPLERWFFGHR